MGFPVATGLIRSWSVTLDAENLVSKIDRLESRQAIEDLASNYCHGFDKRDETRFLSIWWEDCV